MNYTSFLKFKTESDNRHVRRIRKYSFYILGVWTCLLLISAIHNANELNNTVSNLALTEARTAISRDIIYRSWASSHGGVYVPETPATEANPHLKHIPDRDITTPSGIKLTLVNPAYMTRQVYELAERSNAQIGSGHLTSLNPLRPENAPDEWERKALLQFESGQRELYEITTINGIKHIRLIKAFITDKTCLKCHLHQGYKVGDVRGGLSIIMPIKPLQDATKKQIVLNLFTHLALWFFGIIMVAFGSLKLIRSAIEQFDKEIELHEQTIRLEEEIAERQATQESLLISEEKLKAQNNELQTTEDMLRVQINEYETSQNQLNTSLMNLKAIFDVSPLSIIISSYQDGFIREINRTFTKSFGFERDQILGKTGFDIGIWSHVAERQQFISSLKSTHGTEGYPAEVKKSDGTVRNIMMYSTTIDFNNELCLLVIFMDITDQKKIESELRQAQKMDVVGQLAGGVAHDFNNMLTAIIGSVELLNNIVTDERQLKLLSTISNAATRSADLTGQLLAFSRKGTKICAQIWLNKTVQAAIGLLERTIDKNIHIIPKIHATNDMIIGDPTLIQNALLNLGINSRDAMPNGGVITYTTENIHLDEDFCADKCSHITPGHYVEVTVSDNGCGMTNEVMEHIFEPFFTTKPIGKGTGLGLASVYGTIKDHNGCITFHSESGAGTTFKLYFPVGKVESLQSEEALSSGHITCGILLVDDEPLIREMGQILLECYGHTVFVAQDGTEALAIYERERDNISLVILDVIMPVLGGKETLLQLLDKYPDVKVIMSSGYHHNETDDSFLQLGAKGFVQKPYKTNDLMQVIKEVLNR